MIATLTRRITFISVILLALLLQNSCSKDESPEIRGVMNGYMESDTSQDFSLAYVFLTQAFERGYRFTPLKNGRITQLGVRLQAPGIFTVTVYKSSKWASFAFVCAKKNIEQTTYNCWAYEKIEPLEIEKDVNYFITVSIPANISFCRTNPLTFPLKYNNIQILNYVMHFNNGRDNYLEGVNESSTAIDYMEGYPDFIFE